MLGIQKIPGLLNRLKLNPDTQFGMYGMMLPEAYIDMQWRGLTTKAVQHVADKLTPLTQGLFSMQIAGCQKIRMEFPTFLLMPVFDPVSGDTIWMVPTAFATLNSIPYGPVAYQVKGSLLEVMVSSISSLNWQFRAKYATNYYVFNQAHFSKYYITKDKQIFEWPSADDMTATMLADAMYKPATRSGTAEWKKFFAGGAGKVSLDSEVWWDKIPGSITLGVTISLDGKPTPGASDNKQESGQNPDADEEPQTPYSISPEGGEFVPDDKIDVKGLFVSELDEGEKLVARLGFTNYVFNKGDIVSGQILKKVSSSSSQAIELNSYYVIGGIHGYSENKRAVLQVYKCKVE